MPTARQITARQANARLSRGPKTPEGKAASSQNATKFGFFSRDPLVGSESAADFDAHRTAIVESLDPAPGVETMLAHQIADASWRLKRLAPIEAGLLRFSHCDDQMVHANLEIFDLKHEDPADPAEAEGVVNPDAYRAAKDLKAQAKAAINDPENALGRAFLHDIRNNKAFEHFSRYETAFDRRIHRSLQSLSRLQAARRANTAHKKPSSRAEEAFLQNDLTEYSKLPASVV